MTRLKRYGRSMATWRRLRRTVAPWAALMCWIQSVLGSLKGFDHGAGHPLLFLDDAKAPNCQKNNGFSDLGNYSEWPKVAGAVIQAA